jgi:hypothetical protein
MGFFKIARTSTSSSQNRITYSLRPKLIGAPEGIPCFYQSGRTTPEEQNRKPKQTQNENEIPGKLSGRTNYSSSRFDVSKKRPSISGNHQRWPDELASY